MSLRTKVNGITAWVNLRLKGYDLLLNNVLMDLMKGTNVKMLIQSLTGIDNKKLQSFDGLTQQQKTTRVEWIVKELKESGVIPDDMYVDCRLFAMRHADHVFDLLWKLVSHDIWHTWERLEYLTLDNNETLTEIPFEWIPRPAPVKKKKKKVKYNQSLLSGFGSSAVIAEAIPAAAEASPPPAEPHIKFPGEEFCKKFKSRKNKDHPDPEECILEMINKMLKSTREGQKLNVESLEDLVDSRVLCEFVNSFVPGTFTTEILLNDRWSINLAIRMFEKMIRISTPIDSQDLVEADSSAICSTFCVYLMCGFKLRQARAALGRKRELEHRIRSDRHELENNIPKICENTEMLKKRNKLKASIEHHEQEIYRLKAKYDLENCQRWWDHTAEVQSEAREAVARKMKERFDTLSVPRSVTITDLTVALVINLNLTNGNGFYHCKQRESVTPERKIVLRDLNTGDFLDDFSHGRGPGKLNIRKILRLSTFEVIDLNPSNYPQYEIFLESQSKNKVLKAGSEFLYQVFPGNTLMFENLFFKAAKVGELDTIQKLVVFFQDKKPGFINAREKKTGNTALHMAARNGHFEIALYLLENGAHLDTRNTLGATPFFGAVESLNRGISQLYRIADDSGNISFSRTLGSHENSAQLLVEWGTNIWMKNKQSKVVFEVVRCDDHKNHLNGYYDHLQTSIPKLMKGDTELLAKMVEEHVTGVRQFASLRSRCINGSTLLHTAAYFGAISVVKVLLKERVDVNLQDYKGATPLHRAKDRETIKELIEAGANLNAEDSEGNTPLHVKCYGEANKPTAVDCIKEMLAMKINLTHRNNKELMAIHCCAMQGRIDALELLLEADFDDTMQSALTSEDAKSPPSLPHLALANDFLECGKWLVEKGFDFKEHEQDVLVHRLLTEQIQSKQRLDVMRFLFEHGADLDQRYSGGNSPLHYAAGMTGPTDVLNLLVEYGADVDAINEDHCTPLFFATQANNFFGAGGLLLAGANVRHKNFQGLTAFDCILDYDEWLECGCFTDEIKARLKAYSLKHARDLVRAITQKVKGSGRRGLFAKASSAHAMHTRGSSPQHPSLHLINTSSSQQNLRTAVHGAASSLSGRGSMLPPLQPKGFLTY
ncbi:uncharacterized protein [Apostichopus japonicus]|uniref:uncharacterized protein n=1 Tax=Stichopus japonicus TaxID=307972 RepID=UPI003AB84D93